MHGSFIVCLKELIINKFDESFWNEIIDVSEAGEQFYPISNQEILDDLAMRIIRTAIKVLNIDERKLGEIFGNYWINRFAKEKCFAFFDAYKNIRDFINHMSEIHKKITANLPNPAPPFFDVVWENPSTAVINYQSKRGLIHMATGLLKALGDYYQEEISFYRIESNKIKIFIKS